MKMTGFSIDEILSKKTSQFVYEPSIAYNKIITANNTNNQRYLCYQQNDKRTPTYYSRYCRRSTSPTIITTSSNSSFPTGDLEDDKVTRRPRTSITLFQRDFLEEEFQKERYPTLVYIDKLSRKIYLPQYVIKVWFQNRRAKYRKEGYRRKNSHKGKTMESPHTSNIENRTICQSLNDININFNKQNSTSYESYTWILPCGKDKLMDNGDKIVYDGDKEKSPPCSCLKCREGTSYVQY